MSWVASREGKMGILDRLNNTEAKKKPKHHKTMMTAGKEKESLCGGVWKWQMRLERWETGLGPDQEGPYMSEV